MAKISTNRMHTIKALQVSALCDRKGVIGGRHCGGERVRI